MMSNWMNRQIQRGRAKRKVVNKLVKKQKRDANKQVFFPTVMRTD